MNCVRSMTRMPASGPEARGLALLMPRSGIASCLSFLVSQLAPPVEPPAVLHRQRLVFGIDTEFPCRMRRPERIVQDFSADRDEIGAALCDDLLRLLRVHDE